MLVVSTPSFNKDISKIKDKILASRIEQIILKIQLADNLSEIGSLKTMSGAHNAYRIRCQKILFVWLSLRTEKTFIFISLKCRL